MRRSEDRILTTHVGSLPRDPRLSDLLIREEAGEAIDKAELERLAAAAVRHVVQRQLEAGIDIVNDGEQPRVGFQTYVARRMTGFGGVSRRRRAREMDEFPLMVELLRQRFPRRAKVSNAPQAVAEIAYGDLGPAAHEAALFRAALDAGTRQPVEAFMTAASPGIIATTMLNAHYDSHEAYVMALAREMAGEYRQVARDFILQVDAPDLAMERTMMFQDLTNTQFVDIVALHVEAINRALDGIPPERVRLHVCWGNWEGPHIHDIPMAEILPQLYRARVSGLSLEFANPRHQHEYRAFRQHPLPDHMILLPGVIDSTTNFVEHPEVVANRICEAVAAVGDRTRVIPSSDCGFGTFAGSEYCAADVVWAKLRTAREGADLATRRLWGR